MPPPIIRSASLSALQHLRDQRATQYPPDPLPTIIPGGGVSLIAGASGTGKTAFLAWWTTRLRDGLPLFGHQPAPIPCQAILAIDRSWIQSTSKWFEAVGFADILAYSPPDDPDFKPNSLRNKRNRLQVFLDHLGKLEILYGSPLPPGSVVYVDPLAPFLGGNLLDYDACSVACMEIREVCRKLSITIIGTAHTAKLKADKKDRYARVQDRILGSSALLGYTDTQMYLASPDETESSYYSFFWNPHHAPAQTFPLARDPETGLFVPFEDAKRTEVQVKVLDLLLGASEPLPLNTIQLALAPLPLSTVHRHLNDLVKEGVVSRPGRGVYAAVPVS